MEKVTGKVSRPLSPHLQIYRPQMTSVLSILHRATGFALAVGVAMAVWLLVAAAMGPEAYGVFIDFVNTAIGQFMVFGWSVSLFFHLSNGVRHLIWDTGRMFKIEHAYIGGYFVLLSTVILTLLAWWSTCSYLGGP